MKITIPYLQERIKKIEDRNPYWGNGEKKLADLKKKPEYLQSQERRETATGLEKYYFNAY